jgi:sugar phosphate permease
VSLSVSSKLVLGDPSFWFWTLTFFCSLALLWGTASWIPSYLYEQHKFSLAKMGLLAGLPYLFAGLGQLTAGWLADKVFHGKTKYLVVISMLLTVPIVVYLANLESGNMLPLMISLALLGFFVYAPHPVLYGYMQKRYPKEAIGYAIGVSNGMSQFGSFVAPLVMGYLVITRPEGIFYTNAFLFLGGIAFAGAIFSIVISEKKYDYSHFLDK